MTAPTPAAAPGAPADGGTGGQAPQGTQPPQPTPTGDQPSDAQDVKSLPAWAQKVIDETRAEAAKHRTEKQTATQAATTAQKQRDAALKAFGLNPDGTDAPPTEAELQDQITEARNSTWATKVENQVLRLKDVDADRLIDSMAFLNSLDQFAEDDPNSAEFKTKLAAHVQQYVKDNPGFKATPAGPARSGGEFPGGSGAGAAITEDQLASMSPSEIDKAYREGKLKHLM